MKSVPLLVTTFIALLGLCGSGIGQDALTGTYSGSFTATRGPKPIEVRVELVIASVAQGVVKANGKILNGQCAGLYAMEGNYEGNRLTLKGFEGPCPMAFDLTHSGNKLEGTTGAGGPMQLSKSPGGTETRSEKNPGADLVGTFKGSVLGYEPLHVYIGMMLVIREVNNIGVVKGTLTIYQFSCAGTYQMQGRYMGNELRIRALDGPCLPYGFILTHEGNQLSGTNARGFPIQLIK